MTTDPARMFADQRGVTWHLHVVRPDPRRDAERALRMGGRLPPAPPGCYFVARSGEFAALACPPAWFPTPAEVAALTWAALLALLAQARGAAAVAPGAYAADEADRAG